MPRCQNYGIAVKRNFEIGSRLIILYNSLSIEYNVGQIITLLSYFSIIYDIMQL